MKIHTWDFITPLNTNLGTINRTYRTLVFFELEVVPCPRNNRLENQIEPIDAKRPSMSPVAVGS